ncbi:MAG: MFS transporter [Methanobacteriota archaeon]|nr:MAG: MFS transporter [Euryarchaeota archaeon]
MNEPVSAIPSEIEKRGIALMFLAVFIDLLGFGIIIPILPYFVVDTLHGSELEYGAILAIYSLTQFLFSPFWGRLSDRIGRRPVVLVGLFGSSISFFVFGISDSIPKLFFARFLAGFFTAASLPTARAFIADISPPEKRTARMGLIGAAFGLGFTFGPAIGSATSRILIPGFEQFIYAAPSFLASVLALLNFLFAYVNLPETLSEELRDHIKRKREQIKSLGPSRKRIFHILSLPQVLLLVSMFSITTMVFSSFEAMFALYASEIDPFFNESTIGYAFALIGIVVIFVQAGFIRVVVKKLGNEKTVVIGFMLNVLGFILIPFAENRYTLFLFLVPIGIGQGLLTPTLNSLVSLRLSKEEMGEGMGINSGGAAIARVLGPLLGAYLYGLDIHLPFYVAGVMMALLGIVAFQGLVQNELQMQKKSNLEHVPAEYVK